MAATREMGALLLSGSWDYEKLDQIDQVRFRGLMNSLFRGLEQQYLLRKAGALDDESWAAVEAIIADSGSGTIVSAPLPGVGC